MKKLILTLTMAFLASMAVQAQAVYSNTVGMVKLTLNRGEQSIIHNPFESADSEPMTVVDLFGDTLPNGTNVYFWDENQNYIIEQYSRGSWKPGTTEINRVKAMFVNIPSSAANATYDIVVSGNVPDGTAALNTLIALSPGLTLTAFPYPTSISINDANIPANNGDNIYFWNGTNWVIEQFSRGSWKPGTSSFQPGVGFFYLSAEVTEKIWTAIKPYTLD